MNPIFDIDFYKVGHIDQYPKGVTQVWSNWTPRSTRVPHTRSVVNFGLTYFIKEYLGTRFLVHFFNRQKQGVIAEYRDVIQQTLGVQQPRTDHIEALWGLQYLPIEIWSLPEGESVPLNIPPIIITNTDPRFFWLPNYLETILSSVLWVPCTSATTARRYREVFVKHAKAAGETDLGFVDWQGHDFSFRGLAGSEAAILSGMGHLLSFSGTDTIPAILAAKKYYGASLSVGGSAPATEHSVMSAGLEDGEFETFERLLTEVYPSGIVSVVSDTWDLWRVLTDYIPRLKTLILARQGKLVVRPDSGNPVNIICGDKSSGDTHVYAGAMRLLSQALGVVVRDKGLPMIDKGGLIYGDSITVERADEMLTRIVGELRLSPYNMVFGIGAYTYQYVTRDTYGWAMKATAIRRNGEIQAIFKKPVTDDGNKFSHKGILAVYDEADHETHADIAPYYRLAQESTEDKFHNCAYQKVFENSQLLIDPSFDVIRRRVRRGLC